MHTILGAGGPISNSLTKILEAKNEQVRLVSRRRVATTGDTIWVQGDLKDYNSIAIAAKGSSIIYMCAGLKYDKNVWKAEWPLIMQNVIRVAKENNARLLFFDNVYMYGLVHGTMTEETPYNPCSVKGTVRMQIANMIMDEVKAGNLRASIARAADFYGAESMNSIMDLMVLQKLSKGEKAQWIGNVHAKHSFTYVPDAAMGMYLLGRHPESDNQIWHLPTAKALTGKEYIEMAAHVLNVQPKYMHINKMMLRLFGIFNKMVGEVVEMYYQNEYDYVFDSSKFEKYFNFQTTTFENGVKAFASTLAKK